MFNVIKNVMVRHKPFKPPSIVLHKNVILQLAKKKALIKR